MEMKKLQEQAYRIACEHGWYDDRHSVVGEAMLIVSELGEAINADRSDRYAQRRMFEKECSTPQANPDTHWAFCFERFIKDTVEDELADAFLRLLSLSAHIGEELPETPFSAGSIGKGVDAANRLADELKNVEGRDITLAEELFLVLPKLVDVGHEEEFPAESLFFLLVISCRRNIDILWFVNQKMKYNSFRPFRHGNKKY